MIASLLVLLARPILWLRYRIRKEGLEEVKARGTKGILFLANHPALIDPVILRTQLQWPFAPRALADADQIGLPVVRWLALRTGAIPMRDLQAYGEAAKPDVERALDAIVEALDRGDNVMLYPSGTTYRSRYEDLGGNSAVETILARAKGVRVVMVRTTGLWGSRFSRAWGVKPRLDRVLAFGFWRLLANGIVFAPRRRVLLRFEEAPDLPRNDRAGLNRALEAFYNADAPPATYVPYHRFEGGGPRPMPDPELTRFAGDASDVPELIRDEVLARVRETAGREDVVPALRLARDLGMDSLARMELLLWLEQTYAVEVSDPESIVTVGDLILAASGQVPSSAAPLKPVAPAWFRPNTLPVMVPEGDTITGVFLAQAARDPDRVAVADQMGGVRTYRDVITAILVLKPHLARLEGERVGIMLPASAGATILYLAALFAGKVPVMVNWTVGERNVAHGLELLKVRTVLTSAQLLARLESQGLKLDAVRDRFLTLEAMRRDIGLAAKLAAAVRARLSWGSLRKVQPPDTAVILFTSGSESLPKAVPLTHVNMMTNVRDTLKIIRLEPDVKVLGVLPPFHSFGITATILFPLLSGLKAVYHANPTEGATLARLIEAYQVDFIPGTPTFLNGIARAATDAHLRTLRRVITGAEKCPEALYEMLERRWPLLKVHEGYGITECSPVVSGNRDGQTRRGTIGPPFPSVEHAIREVEGDRRVAPGQPGMLLVRGPSVFGGYLHHAGPSPFETFEGRDWYRTGDLVREEPDGHLVFVGRLKRFVKLGGEMVSLPAIEEALLLHFGREDDEGPALAVEATPVDTNPELVLFAIRAITRDEANSTLREAGLSPLHNIRHVRIVERIPVLGTGKTDYRALRALLVPSGGPA